MSVISQAMPDMPMWHAQYTPLLKQREHTSHTHTQSKIAANGGHAEPRTQAMGMDLKQLVYF